MINDESEEDAPVRLSMVLDVVIMRDMMMDVMDKIMVMKNMMDTICDI